MCLNAAKCNFYCHEKNLPDPESQQVLLTQAEQANAYSAPKED